MADYTAPVAHSAAASNSTPDAVHLHARACNALNRCLRELNANHTDYEALAQHMHQAQNAVAELRVMDTVNLWH